MQLVFKSRRKVVFKLSPFRVKPRPRPNHAHFRQELNSKKETQLGKFELSPMKKEGPNSKSVKMFDACVKPRHLRHLKEQ
jgi:hypothetical protein